MGKAERVILLTGMMGSGKSAVGRELAQRLGVRFVDTDVEIERKRGCAVAEIFRREGEAAFRSLERAELEALPAERAVVALGGGALVAAGNRALLPERSVLVWLDARPETLAERLGDADERPLLAGLSAAARVERLRELCAERAEVYARAQLRIPTDGRTPAQVCDALLTALPEEYAA